jgi:hypothetical protein
VVEEPAHPATAAAGMAMPAKAAVAAAEHAAAGMAFPMALLMVFPMAFIVSMSKHAWLILLQADGSNSGR